MIHADRLRSVTDVFTHQTCPDGTASAVICAEAFRLLGTSPRFHTLQYGTDFMEKLEPRSGQLFVDITPPAARWREWEPFSPIVLDHHETVRHVTEGLGGVYATNERHSGAMLAFENVLTPAMREALGPASDQASDGVPSACLTEAVLSVTRWHFFAELAMVRDTWKKDSPLWDAACAQAEALNLYGHRTLVDSAMSGGFSAEALDSVGRLLLERARWKSERSADQARWGSVRGPDGELRFAVFNCTDKLTSDVANALIERGADFAAGYFYVCEDGSDVTCVSLRSRAGVSARAMAEVHGGGGHDRAAGFRLPEVSPSALMEVLKSALVRTSR